MAHPAAREASHPAAPGSAHLCVARHARHLTGQQRRRHLALATGPRAKRAARMAVHAVDRVRGDEWRRMEINHG